MRRELIGTPDRELWRSKDSDFAIVRLKCKQVVLGEFPAGSLVPGLEYRFVGQDEQHKVHGKQFKVFGFVQREPSNPGAVIQYLSRLDKIGPVMARRIYERFKDRAVQTLADDPMAVYRSVKGLGHKVALEASESIKQDNHFRDTKVELIGLLGGRGFPGILIDECIKKWGVHAGQRVKADPFVLLEQRLPGCGFLRVDQLYQDLGYPLKSERRLSMLAWHTVRSDMSGHTWHRWDELVSRMVGLCEVNPKQALETAVAQKWLTALRIDGAVWIAETKKSEAEVALAGGLMELMT